MNKIKRKTLNTTLQNFCTNRPEESPPAGQWETSRFKAFSEGLIQIQKLE